MGLGFLFAPTKWPILKPAFDSIYSMFAKNHLQADGTLGGRLVLGAPGFWASSLSGLSSSGLVAG